MMGVVFMVGPGIYAFAAPFWGGLTDAKVRTLSFMAIATMYNNMQYSMIYVKMLLTV